MSLVDWSIDEMHINLKVSYNLCRPLYASNIKRVAQRRVVKCLFSLDLDSPTWGSKLKENTPKSFQSRKLELCVPES